MHWPGAAALSRSPRRGTVDRGRRQRDIGHGTLASGQRPGAIGRRGARPRPLSAGGRRAAGQCCRKPGPRAGTSFCETPAAPQPAGCCRDVAHGTRDGCPQRGLQLGFTHPPALPSTRGAQQRDGAARQPLLRASLGLRGLSGAFLAGTDFPTAPRLCVVRPPQFTLSSPPAPARPPAAAASAPRHSLFPGKNVLRSQPWHLIAICRNYSTWCCRPGCPPPPRLPCDAVSPAESCQGSTEPLSPPAVTVSPLRGTGAELDTWPVWAWRCSATSVSGEGTAGFRHSLTGSCPLPPPPPLPHPVPAPRCRG